MTIAQAQAAQAAKVASPQAQGVTPGAVPVALPTNLNTFSFQSAVTLPVQRRQEAGAKAALW